MTRSLCVLAALTLFSEFLVGCDSVRKSFGGGKNAPDEFVVYKRPPLSLPPEYGLRPP
ncbi:MAG: beta-barrel assembly machine subunit BamF, partial [Magnetovibrio sp.]|nr:beta-barrel assembly machine subunit BamF [Magnetovibrio sp.]